MTSGNLIISDPHSGIRLGPGYVLYMRGSERVGIRALDAWILASCLVVVAEDRDDRRCTSFPLSSLIEHETVVKS